jgi:BMFP domain-containing protein YqiC
MQTQNRLLDDLARVASSAMGIATGMRSEAEARLREQFEKIISQMDLVTREEHEVVQAMAQKAREDQEAMAERVDKLEARIAELEHGKSSASTGKSASSASAGKSTTGGKSGSTKKSGGSSKSGGSASGGSGS